MVNNGSTPRVGVWFIGAFGGVATTAAVGIAALKRNLQKPIALATSLPRFAAVPFPGFDEIVVGGCDVRRSTLRESAAELMRTSRVFSPELLDGVADDLNEWTEEIRPGVVRQSGGPVESFADWRIGRSTDRDFIRQVEDDLRAFQIRKRLDDLIVVNVSSSEPMPNLDPRWKTWEGVRRSLETDDVTGLPASSLYGLAAARVGAAYVNFTPSTGVCIPGIREHLDETGGLHMGRDGKTGETLMKAVLAPMFARRNLEVMSWVGHNILGNRDGKVLQDPINKRGKLESKDHLISDILGYAPQTLVTIEHIDSMGDWKTAWDHIHFEGFLGTKMTLQFIWQGCDSLLAAPLVVDLIRWTAVAQRRGDRGCMTHLAGYFKSPTDCDEQDFFRQWDSLERYVERFERSNRASTSASARSN